MLWNFKVSEAWMNLWNNTMQEKAGSLPRVKKQNSKKRFEKNEHACSVEGIFLLVVSDSAAR